MDKYHNYTFAGLSRTPCATLDEAFEKYFMDFNVIDQPLYYIDPQVDLPRLQADLLDLIPDKDYQQAAKALQAIMDTRLETPRRRQLIHATTFAPLSTVGMGYLVQVYRDAFGIAEPLVAGGVEIVGGGILNVGEKAILLLEGKGVFRLAPGFDIVNRYALLSGHDGDTKIEVRMAPYCPRTGTTITFDASRPLCFKHTRNSGARVRRASTVLRNVTENWNEFTRGVQKMVSFPISHTEGRAFIDAVISTTIDEPSTKIENLREQVFDIWTTTGVGTRLPQCCNTVFGVVQAFAEYCDKFKTVRKSKIRNEVAAGIEARLCSAGAKQKQRAYAFGLFLANNKKLPTVSGK